MYQKMAKVSLKIKNKNQCKADLTLKEIERKV